MALATTLNVSGSNCLSGANTPVSVQCDWITVVSDASSPNNSGNTVVAPASITANTLAPLNLNGKGTTVQVRMSYQTGATVTTSPTVQLFGFDSNGLPERLVDADGNHELTLTADASNDVQLATSNTSYTSSKEVDANGARQVYVTVKTAASVSAGTPKIMVRVK